MDSRCFAFVFFCLAATVISQLPQQETYDYCDPTLKLCEVFIDHTMCQYPFPGLSPHCTKNVHEPLNSTEKDRILYWHNKFRSYVANGSEKIKTRKLATSSNMRQMYWDPELEAIATRWAEQCTSMTNPVIYDKCRNTKRFRVSQNVGTRRVNGSTIEKQAPQIVITWYKENKEFDPNLVDRFTLTDDKVSVKQFANIIWADSYALGCARVIFQQKLPLGDSKSTVWTVERLVCNYGPGLEVGKPIYKRGAPCEKCPSRTECSPVFPGLCAIQSTNKEGGNAMPPQLEKGQTTEDPVISEEMEVNLDSEEEEKEYENYDLYNYYESCKGNEECLSKIKLKNRFNFMLRFPHPTGGKYFVKKGIYLNGKCHCSDIRRSRGARAPQPPLRLSAFLCLLFGSPFTYLLSYF